MKAKDQKNQNWKFPKVVFKVILAFIFILYLQFGYLSLFPVIYGINMDAFAQNRNTVKTTLYAKRGTIFDRDSKVLALNVTSYTVIAYLAESRTGNSSTPLHVVDKKMTAEKLSPILNMSVEYIEKLLNYEAYQVELGPGGRGISELKKEEIEALQLPGIDFMENHKRNYPNGDFASYTLGYAKQNEDGSIVGELGIEVKYEELLKGEDGYLEYQQDRFGYKIPDTKETRIESQDGNDIYLTIDSSIQRFIEGAIKEVSEVYQPEWLMLTAMDAKTGEILGTSATPSFDPNIRNITNYENPLVSYLYEPGSVMKIYTYMCAMEKGTYKGNDMFESGSIKIGDDLINDWNKKGWGKITYDKGFEYSSNVGIVNMLQGMLTKNDLRDCFKKYGFSQKTDIELPREFNGSIKFTYPVEVATAGFGQGITTTAIQQLQALTLISNNGKMLKPHIIDKIVNPNTGEIVYESLVEESDPLVSLKTVNQLKDLMYDVIYGTDAGTTGRAYQIKGFDVIGKTGTSQIYDTKTGKYLDGENDYIFSFGGMYPKEDPEIIIYGAMRKPKMGAAVALSKATKSVMESIAKYRNMFSHVTEGNTVHTYTLPSFMSQKTSDVKKVLENNQIHVVLLGSGTTVIGQYPKSGSEVLSNDKVFLVTNQDDYTLPDFSGWSRSEVIAYLKLIDFQYEFNGYGYVVNQSIKAGTKIQKGGSIKFTLKPKYDFDKLDQTDDNQTKK